MNLSEKIIKELNELPEIKKREVLDFVEYLKLKTEKEENNTWSNLSISAAMRDMMDEPPLYSMQDLKETF